MHIGDYTVVSPANGDILVIGPDGAEVRIATKNGKMYVIRGSNSEILPDSVNGLSAVLVRKFRH